MGRKSKAQLAEEANARALQKLSDEACDTLDKQKVKINSGVFSKGNTALEDYESNIKNSIGEYISEDKGSMDTKRDVTKMLQSNVTYAVALLIKKMKNPKTPVKERNDIAELVITSLYGKAPLDNNIDTKLEVVFSDEIKQYAK